MKTTYLGLWTVEIPDEDNGINIIEPFLGGRLEIKRVERDSVSFKLNNTGVTDPQVCLRGDFTIHCELKYPNSAVAEYTNAYLIDSNVLQLSTGDWDDGNLTFHAGANNSSNKFNVYYESSSFYIFLRGPALETHILERLFKERTILKDRFRWQITESFRCLLHPGGNAYDQHAGPDVMVFKKLFDPNKLTSDASIVDSLRNGTVESGHHQQYLQLNMVTVYPRENGRVDCQLVPVSGALHIDPAIRDRDVGSATRIGNPISYGVSLVNGSLEFSNQFQNPPDQPSVLWSNFAGDDEPTHLLVNNITDENGLPIALETLDKIELKRRRAYRTPPETDQGLLKLQNHFTIGGLVIGGLESQVNDPNGSFPVTLRKLDVDDEDDTPKVVESEHKGERLIYKLAKDHFVLNPGELNGIALNTIMGVTEPNKPLSADYQVSGDRFAVPEGMTDDPDIAFVASSIDLVDDNYRVEAIFEEQEYAKEKVPDLDADAKKATTRNKSIDNAHDEDRISLPAMDIKFATANMVKEGIDDVDKRKSQTARESQNWVKELDKKLVEQVSAFQSEGLKQHTAGFKMAEAPAHSLDSILGKVPGKAMTVQSTAERPIDLKMNDTERGDGRPTRLIFGKTKPTSPNAPADSSDFIVEAERAYELVKYRTWFLQFMFEGRVRVEGVNGQFKDPHWNVEEKKWIVGAESKTALARWNEVITAYTALKQNKDLIEYLYQQKRTLLRNLEGFEEPVRMMRQLVWMVADLFDEHLDEHVEEMFDLIAKDFDGTISDYMKFEEKWMDQDGEFQNDSKLKGISKSAVKIQRMWDQITKSGANYKTIFDETVQLSTENWPPPSPGIHQLVLSLTRLVRAWKSKAETIDFAEEFKNWKAFRKLLEVFPRELREKGFVEIYASAWVGKEIKGLPAGQDDYDKFKLLINGADDSAIAIKDHLLDAVELTQGLALRFATRLGTVRKELRTKAGDDQKAEATKVLEYYTDAARMLEEVAERFPGFDALVEQGKNVALQKLTEIWEEERELLENRLQLWLEGKTQAFREEFEQKLKKELKSLRALLPEGFNEEAYEGLLARSKELRDFFGEIIKLGENSGDLLETLKSEPPEYLVVGKAFHIKFGKAQEEILKKLSAMWGRSFELCSLGSKGKGASPDSFEAWDFSLDTKTTLVLKLTGNRTLEEILVEIQNQSRDNTGECDPLGIWSPELEKKPHEIGPPHKVTEGEDKELHKKQEAEYHKDLVAAYIKVFVDEDLRQPGWRGVFLVNPMADLERNQVTRDLCGLRFIRARYIALGGEAQTFNYATPLDTLDVYATIYKVAEKQERKLEDNDPKNRNTDAGIALTKFDARIKNTKIRANSSIELKLDIDRLFGRDREGTDQFSSTESKKKFTDILIRGTTKEPDKKDEGVALEFAAIFPQVLILDIDVMCIKQVALRAIRAGVRNGQTCLDIDGDIILQNWKPPELDFDLSCEDLGRLKLMDFRLMFPPAKDVVDAAMGLLRNMRFDFAALEFKFPTPRVLTAGVLELKFVSMGYLRKIGESDDRQNAVANLANRFDPFVGNDFSEIKENDFVYIVFDIDFGKLPKFGGNNLEKLQLRLLVGAELLSADLLNPMVALGGLNGQDITLDFFRVLTMTIKKIFYSRDVKSTLPRYQGQRLSVLGAEDLRLQLLGIDLIGEQRGEDQRGADGEIIEGRGLDFLMLQNQESERGLLGLIHFGGREGDKDKDRGFINLHWFLLGRNISVDDRILDHLLLDKPFEDGNGIIANTVVRSANKKFSTKADAGSETRIVESIRAAVTGQEDWLFGISFSVCKELLENCRLILHDDHYYGIHLQAEWLKELIESDTLTLAYIPGQTASQDRFLLDIPLSFLNLMSNLKAGWGTFSWAMNTDTLIGLGFPWRHGSRYRWDRSFALYISPYMGQAGFYIEKKTFFSKQVGKDIISIGGGLGVAFGFGFASGSRSLYVRAGIQIFVIVEGHLYIRVKQGVGIDPAALLNGSLHGFSIRGVLGIIAFVEGGINIWIISASFRAEIQAALSVSLEYIKDQPLMLTYNATLYAGYHASARISMGFTKITFTVSGQYPIGVEGQKQLN